MLVSIIIPTYNSSKFLKETINSVLSQTYKEWELIVIDDGSIDRTRVTVEEFSKNDKRLLYHYQENAGQACARNKGIGLSTGKYIAFLDADDLWHEEKLEHQLVLFEKHQSIDLIYSKATSFSDSKIKTNQHVNYNPGLNSDTQLLCSIFNSSQITNSSVVVKKHVFDKFGLFNELEIHRGTEDFEMWMRLAAGGCVFYAMNVSLVKYRIHIDGTHQNRLRMVKGAIAVYEQYKKDSRIPEDLKLKRYRNYYRELLKEIVGFKKPSVEFDDAINLLREIDKNGIITRIQYVLSKLFPPLIVLRFSQIFLYRILAKFIK